MNTNIILFGYLSLIIYTFKGIHLNFKIIKNQVELHLVVKPNAQKNEIRAFDEKGLSITLRAKPHNGEANKELIAYLAKVFKTPKSQIVFKKGEESRYKTILIPLTQEIQNYLDKL